MNKSFLAERSGLDPQAVAARNEEILGQPQRVEPLAPDELTDDARALIERIRASTGSQKRGLVPEYFLTMIKHTDIFRCQLEMGTVLFKGVLPQRDRELAVLRIGWLLRAPYEWGEHVAIAHRYGVTVEEVECVIQGSGEPGWSPHDAAILRGVEELLSEQAVSDETWTLLAKSWSEQQLIEFLMVVGQYVANALVQNGLRMRLSPGNPGFSHR